MCAYQPLDDYALRRKWDSDKYLEDMVLRTGMPIPRFKHHYVNVTKKILNDFKKCDFYNALDKKLRELHDEYYREYEYELIEIDDSLEMKIKDFEKMLDKCWRTDIKYNEHFNEADYDWSEYEWIDYNNFFYKLKDVIRTRIFIRYLDGVDILIKEIKKLAEEFNYCIEVEPKADETGYYGTHINIIIPFEIPDINPGTKKINCCIELQLSSVMKDVVNELLHKKYELERVRLDREIKIWQWDYESTDFVVNYLGHIVHYTEGMIMDARKKMRDEVQK